METGREEKKGSLIKYQTKKKSQCYQLLVDQHTITTRYMKWPKANVMDESLFSPTSRSFKTRSSSFRLSEKVGGTFSFRHFSHVNFHDVKHSTHLLIQAQRGAEKYPGPPLRFKLSATLCTMQMVVTAPPAEQYMVLLLIHISCQVCIRSRVIDYVSVY